MTQKRKLACMLKMYDRLEGVRWVLVLMLLIVLPFTGASQCDVLDSGLDRAGREIGAAYVQCSAGRIVWQYPRSGLRVLMKSPLPEREFKACIKADSSFGGARVMIEGRTSLVPLLAVNDGRPLQLERCFSSYNGEVALFLEADLVTDGFNPHIAAFSYDVQVLPKGEHYQPSYDCRPCTNEELLQTVCTADILATGRLLAVDQRGQVHHPANNHLTPSPLAAPGTSPSRFSVGSPSSYGAELTFMAAKILKEPHGEDSSGSSAPVFGTAKGGAKIATVSVPGHCGMKAGPGDFLLMGRMKLGSPVLQCIPQLEKFKDLLNKVGDKVSCMVDL